ncbi:hypothetical protein MKW98_011547 [Papaver atlanticum]|uniref:Uncharacterized protein n=1 Tax=Papaver atlanticum TaxID=357466 RepID=A0AAD4S856_9MAGN|nr:hypothetical protein MKW98_011547 [Papaver atlanticum]
MMYWSDCRFQERYESRERLRPIFDKEEFDGFFLDYLPQYGNQDTMGKLLELAEHISKEKIGKNVQQRMYKQRQK